MTTTTPPSNVHGLQLTTILLGTIVGTLELLFGVMIFLGAVILGAAGEPAADSGWLWFIAVLPIFAGITAITFGALAKATPRIAFIGIGIAGLASLTVAPLAAIPLGVATVTAGIAAHRMG